MLILMRMHMKVMVMRVMVIMLMSTGTWMTIQIEIEGDVMQQNADNACVGALGALCTENWEHCADQVLAAIVVFAQISVNSPRCTHAPVTQCSILNASILLSLKSSMYLCEH